MKKRAADTVKHTRKQRPRPTPKWLLQKQELDEIAQRRTLMLLEVLSGEKPVTEAITEAQISRGHYYQLEERALKAVMESMEPGAAPGRPVETTTRLLQLEEKVKGLERDKRRLERLLQLTRKVLRPGPMKSVQGRPRGRRSTSPGRSISTNSGSTAPDTKRAASTNASPSSTSGEAGS
jgi:hypothetical protein